MCLAGLLVYVSVALIFKDPWRHAHVLKKQINIYNQSKGSKYIFVIGKIEYKRSTN